jgi:ribosomal protein L9
LRHALQKEGGGRGYRVEQEDRGAGAAGTLREEAKAKSESEDLAKLLAGVIVTISQKAGENGQLFGSVTSKDVADALATKNYTIESAKGAVGRAD